MITVQTEPIVQIADEEEKSQMPSNVLSDLDVDVVEIVIDDSSDEKPLVSPPRKSARLSALRRDSMTDSEISVTSKCESPVPRRRSMRLSSTSSIDTPPRRPKEDNNIKKLPTIAESEKPANDVQSPKPKVNDDAQKSEKEMVDELAAAFVGEFIDIDD